MFTHFDKTWDLLLGKLGGWLRDGVLLMPNFAVAVISMVLFWLVARTVRALFARLLRRISHVTQINDLLAQTVFVVIVVAGLFTSLGILGLDKAVTSLLAGAGIVGLALSLAFQGVATNLMAGIYLSIERPFQVGNLILTNGMLGTVERINLLWTELRLQQGQIAQLPNNKIFTDTITNFSISGRRRLEVELHLAYGADLAKAKHLACSVLGEGAYCKGKADAFLQEAGDSAVKLVVGAWLNATGEAEFQAARSDAIERLQGAFAAAAMPLPSGLPVPRDQPAPPAQRHAPVAAGARH
jgi:small conductance mechanosensitive channel